MGLGNRTIDALGAAVVPWYCSGRRAPHLKSPVAPASSALATHQPPISGVGQSRMPGGGSMKPLASLVLASILLSIPARPAQALDAPIALKESIGSPPAGAPPPCGPIGSVLDGNCANYRWYNVCSGYIWVYAPIALYSYSTIFRSDELPCIAAGHQVRRGITYFRNVSPGYNQSVDVLLESDPNGDGCPPFVTLASDLKLDPGLRWNCSPFGTVLPATVTSLIVRVIQRGYYAPNWATDGPFTEVCDPDGNDHSFYYDAVGGCVPWRQLSPRGRGDNFLTWLVLDDEPESATESASWGQIKSLYR